MQKKNPLITCMPFLLFIFSCYSCTSGKVTDPVLLRADSLMECCADSALVLLGNIEYPQEMKRSERALYGLLLTKARDKCLVEHVGDSLILATVNYYEKYNDDNKKAEAYFYLGSVYRDMGMTLNEIEAFQKALQAKGDKEDRMTALICNNLSALYSNQDFFSEAHVMVKRAYSISLGLNNQLDIIHFARNLGLSYQAIEKQDSALFYYKEALSKALMVNDTYFKTLLYTNIGDTYTELNRLDSAYHYLSKSMHISREETSFSTLYSIGKILHKTGQLDSARTYLLPCLVADNINIRAASRLELSKIEEKAGNILKSLHYNKEFLALNDTIDINLQRKETAVLIKNTTKMTEEKKLYITKMYVFVFLILLLFIITVGWHLFSRKKKPLQKNEDKKSLTTHSSINEIMNSMINRDDERFEQCVKYLRNTSHYAILETLKNNPKNRNLQISDKRDSLKNDITTSFLEIINALSEYFIELSKDDLYCCVLYLLDFKSPAVETIMGVSNDALRKRRSRIKKIISDELYAYIFFS